MSEPQKALPYLSCRLEAHAGALQVRTRFDLAAPWTCLFGPSGSGKTTLLRALAGFLQPRSGILQLGDGRVLFDSARRFFVPAHRRPIRIALQQPWLFPGSVRSNLGFALRSANPQAEDELLHRFELGALASAHVRTLSGGQQQRVSLARTIGAALYAREPVALVLLDEPFTGFDLELRNRLALELRAWLLERRIPVLSVTHDVPEALLLEAETIRLREGEIVSQGPARTVLASERETLLRTLG